MFTSFADQTLILCVGGKGRGVVKEHKILVTVDRFMYALPIRLQQLFSYMGTVTSRDRLHKYNYVIEKQALVRRKRRERMEIITFVPKGDTVLVAKPFW